MPFGKMTSLKELQKTCPLPLLCVTRKQVAPLSQLALAAAIAHEKKIYYQLPGHEKTYVKYKKWLDVNARALTHERHISTLPYSFKKSSHWYECASRAADDELRHEEALEEQRARSFRPSRSQRRKAARQRRDESPSARPPIFIPVDVSADHAPTCLCIDCTPDLHST